MIGQTVTFKPPGPPPPLPDRPKLGQASPQARLIRTSCETDYSSVKSGERAHSNNDGLGASNVSIARRQQSNISPMLGPLAINRRPTVKTTINSLPSELITHIGNQDIDAAKVMRLLSSEFKNSASASISHIAIRDRTKLAEAIAAYTAGGINKITLRESDVTDVDLLMLPETVTEVDLHGCRNLTVQGFKNLENIANLKKANFSYCNVDDDMATAISQIKSIVDLDISDNHVSCKGAVEIAKMKLKKINIGMNNIGDLGARAFAENNTIEWLDARFNNVGDNGASAFKGTKKKHLDLSINDIGDPGATELATDSEFELLNVRNNLFGDAGLRALRSNHAIAQLIT
ncbi:hypothetical protein [Paraburkholderia aspalathi]|uniref:hypothetical protein n=1 Tax=Paraburkholderia aspalathi TaxID=1324617 RepID=UPI0038BA1CC8